MSLIKQTLWSIAPLIIVTALNIVSVPLFYRYLGAELYALWFYVLTFTGAFGFMDLGLGVAVGRYIGVAIGRNDLQAVREYWGTGNAVAIPLLATMALIFGIVGVIFGPKWFNVDPQLVGLLRWSFLRIGTSLLQIIPSIVLAWATRNPLILIFWTAVIAAVQLAIFVGHAKKSYQLTFGFGHAQWHRAHEMAVYTGKTFASLIVGSFVASADRLILGKLALPFDFTNYAICSNVGGRILALSGAVMGPVFSNTNRAIGRGIRESVATIYNEIFDFTFPWYALISIWIWLWHPILLRLWLGQNLAVAVAPIVVPIIVGCCLTGISNVSTAQLGSLNRVGTSLIFSILTGALLVVGVIAGWRWNGVVGVAWAFLLTRVVLVVQDLFVILLVGAGGWLAASTWKNLAVQVAVGLAFSSTIFLWPRHSLWQLIPAFVHGGVISALLLHQPVKNFLFRTNATATARVP